MNHTDLKRRHFLKLLGSQAAMGGFGLGAWTAMSSVAAQNATDSRFLVCLYLRGGNDQSNTVVPRSGTAYQTYRSIRPDVALDSGLLNAVTPINAGAPDLGLHPALVSLAQRFNDREAAVIANVGNLVAPMTASQWNNGNPVGVQGLPLQLFSHNDQESQWQTANPSRPMPSGWMGRMADRLTDTFNGADNPLPMCLNVGRTNIMLTGDRTVPFRITPYGVSPLVALSGFGGTDQTGQAMRDMFKAARTDAFQAHVSTVLNRGIDLQSRVQTALDGVNYATQFPETFTGPDEYGEIKSQPFKVAQQFKAVANMMSASSALGHRRQIYFVDMDGFDFHDNLPGQQNQRLSELDGALSLFCDFLKESGLWSNTVVFTASDFGRALQTNGKGTDHGWGGHHFVVGGPVKGGGLYGQWPDVALNTAQDAGQGRLIPTTSIEQYGVTLARWFGLTAEADLRGLFPNYGNFSHSNVNLDFLA